jgi:transcriptional regulator with XRE-family HTH domain
MDLDKIIKVDGDKLDKLIKSRYDGRGMDFAAEVGVTPYTLSGWRNNKVVSMARGNFTAVATALGIEVDMLWRAVGIASKALDLTDAEADWLQIYKRLSPLDRARLRVSVEEIVSQFDASQ